MGALETMKPTITDIPGIGPVAADALAEHNITTVYRLSRSTIEKIAAVPGFSEARAARVIAAAAELHGTPAEASPPEGETPLQTTGKQPDSGKKKAKKGKGKGKGKDKNKGKGKGKGKGKDKGKGKGKGKGKTKKKGKK